MSTLRWRPLSPDLDLHAPGLPDRLLTDGEHLGWQDSGGVYVDLPDGVCFLALPDIVDLVAAGPSLWVAVTSAPAVFWGAPGEPWQQRALSPGRWRAGGTWLHGRRGLGHQTETLSGVPVPSPMGATRAQPLPDQDGLVWAGSAALYHLDAGGRVRVLDALPSACVGLLPGPAGSIVVETQAEGVAASVAGRLLVPLPEAISAEGGRISPDGRRALLPTEDGTGLFDLRTGALLTDFPGVSPVGFRSSGGLLLLDDALGMVQDADEVPVRGGFVPAAPLRVGTRLYGPGGAAWDLASGEVLFETPELSAEALLFDDESGEALVFALQEDTVVIIDAETGDVLGEEPREGAADADLSPVEADLLEDADAAALGGGLPVDCGVVVEGRQWLWSSEGLLVSRAYRR